MRTLLLLFSVILFPIDHAAADRTIYFNLPECGVKQHLNMDENSTFTIKIGPGCNFDVDTTPTKS